MLDFLVPNMTHDDESDGGGSDFKSFVRRNTHTHTHTPLKNIPPKYPNHQHNKPTTMKKHIANT